MSLTLYKRKRDFAKSPEPKGGIVPASGGSRFVIQKHHASHLHYDLRLELDGVLKSWAVPKGPTLDPKVKRLAIHVEDHPIEYARFEGVIPSGYGAGTVIVWDEGQWIAQGDATESYKNGKITFELQGEKLNGMWKLIRTRPAPGGKEHWLFIKVTDKHARDESEYSIVDKKPKSVLSGKTIEKLGGGEPKTPSRRDRRAAHRKEIPSGAASSTQAQHADASSVVGAKAAPWPREVKPQLAALGERAPSGDDWCHEIKFDGYRLLAHIKDGQVRLTTRTGLDWTARFKALVPALEALPIDDGVLDGEVVALDAQGRSNFQLLQNQLKSKVPVTPVLYLFDVIHCNGYDVAACTLADRKELLRRITAGLSKTSNVQYTDHIVGNVDEVVEHACKLGLEGIISKKLNSPYRFSRSTDWVKTKCLQRQEFLIVGYTNPKGSRAGFGSLLLGVQDNGHAAYSGRVGTGFDDAGLRALRERLEALQVEKPAVKKVPAEMARGVHWVEPRLVAEVKFTGWTDDGRLRHPVFIALREDKKASEVVREVPMTVTHTRKAAGVKIAGVPISHPDRIVYGDLHISKQTVVEYYDTVADLMLPYVIGRPLTLLRCPQGAGGECFYQRNLTGSFPPGVVGIQVTEKDGPSTCVAIESRAGLIALIQMGALEIHPWGSRGDNPDQPDQIIFDLILAPEVAWKEVVHAAHTIRAELFAKLEFAAFVKTSGGKGLHAVVPLRRRALWPEVKDFAAAFAGSLVRSAPDRLVATMSKAKRTGKIFIDHFRNGRGATAIAPYSTRAKPAATVSAPLAWDDLTPATKNESFTVLTMPGRLAKQKNDPWADFDSDRQALTQARQRAVMNGHGK